MREGPWARLMCEVRCGEGPWPWSHSLAKRHTVCNTVSSAAGLTHRRSTQLTGTGRNLLHWVMLCKYRLQDAIQCTISVEGMLRMSTVFVRPCHRVPFSSAGCANCCAEWLKNVGLSAIGGIRANRRGAESGQTRRAWPYEVRQATADYCDCSNPAFGLRWSNRVVMMSPHQRRK